MKYWIFKSIFLLLLFNLACTKNFFKNWDTETYGPLPPPPQQVIPPPKLLQAIEKIFPEFKIAQSKDYCKDFTNMFPSVGPKQWAYGLVSADFNGDQLKDYSLIIRHKKKYYWLGALASQNPDLDYEIKIFGPPKTWGEKTPKTYFSHKLCYGILLIGKAGENALVLYHEKKDASHPDFNPYPYVGIEEGGAAIQFFWKNGQWHETGYEP
ncbi:MAG: hypothetical protein KDK66_02600 [Deltaproteobacteria bacterium]|nr:hypothetical protein [Deltaproteobacteria bacterium]